MRKPRGYSKAFTARLERIVVDEGFVIPSKYTLYGCDLRFGYCCYDRKIIVIPRWTVMPGRRKRQQGDRYVVYYLAHEIAHSLVQHRSEISSHGAEFMARFMDICPKELQHYELGYKPRHAKAAGIGEA